MEFEKALLDPTSVFANPAEVCETSDLSHDQKVEILRRWEYDARELQVAAEENMQGREDVPLDEVLKALHALGEEASAEKSTPTKQ